MGFLRGLGKAIVGLIFFTLISLMLMNIVFYQTTKSDFMKPLFVGMLAQGFESQDMATYNEALAKCKTAQTYNPPVSNLNLTIPCSKISSSNQSEFSKLIAESLFDQALYTKKCNGVECLQMQDISGFATKGFNLFLKTSMIILIVLSSIFAVFAILLSKGWPAKLTALSMPFIIDGISVIPLMLFKSKINLGGMQFFADKFIDLLIKDMAIVFALGILLLIISILIKKRSKPKKKEKNKKRKK